MIPSPFLPKALGIDLASSKDGRGKENGKDMGKTLPPRNMWKRKKFSRGRLVIWVLNSLTRWVDGWGCGVVVPPLFRYSLPASPPSLSFSLVAVGMSGGGGF